MPELPPIPIICGPTATGKTAIALTLAESFPLEIISADSRQMIKHLDIGTAKPTKEEQARATFHLLDLIEPGERYTAFRFIDDATKAIKSCLERKNIPLVVGGTGFYLRALTEGIVEIEQENTDIRQQLEEELAREGAQKMYERLEAIDPLEAARLHPHNTVRVLRALEIFYLTGKSKSELSVTGAYHKSEYAFEYYCLLPEREELYRTIEARVDAMIEQGWLEEVRTLYQNGLGAAVRKANVIGYNELLDYLEEKLTWEEAVRFIKQNTRRYAKRQTTWFRRQTSGKFFSNGEALLEHLTHVLKNF